MPKSIMNNKVHGPTPDPALLSIPTASLEAASLEHNPIAYANSLLKHRLCLTLKDERIVYGTFMSLDSNGMMLLLDPQEWLGPNLIRPNGRFLMLPLDEVMDMTASKKTYKPQRKEPKKKEEE